MTALYRLQTVVALTRAELNALATLVLLAVVGLGAQSVQKASAAPLAASEQNVRAAFVVRSTVAPAALAGSVEAVKDSARAAVAAEPPVEMEAVTALLPPSASAHAAEASASADTPTAHERRSQRKPAFAGRMNLNTATSAELQRLPRIGEAMAQRILDYRREHGRFGSVNELNNVRGIGDKTLEKLRPHLYV